MKKITAVIPPKRPGSRTTVCFSDGTSWKLIPLVAEEQGLFPGMELDDAAFERIRAANGEASAKQRAVRIISAAGVTKQDLERRLCQKGEQAQDAKKAVAWLDELHLIDDAEIARQIVARGAARGYGEKRIKQMLFEKRVPRVYWEQALSAMPDQSDALEQFLASRLGAEPDEKARRSAVSAAARRGFSWQEISAALARLGAEPED